MRASSIWGGIIIVFLALPYLLLLAQFGIAETVAQGTVLWALKNSLAQASGTASVALLLGLFGALGLMAIKSERLRNFSETLFLIPSFLPSLFLVLSALVIFKTIPKKNSSIIILQGLSYAGLVAVGCASIIRSKLGKLAELSLIEGCGFWRFFYVGVLRYLRRDLFHQWLLVFGISLSSFSIPLLIGGVMGTNIEVLIYEKIVLLGDWSQGLTLSLLQILILFAFSFVIRASHRADIKEARNMSLISRKEFLPILFVVTFGFLLSPLASLTRGMEQLKSAGIGLEEIKTLSIETSIVAIAGAFSVVLGGLFLSLGFAANWFNKVIKFFISPSLVLLGFVFIVSPTLRDLDYHVKICIGFAWLALPALYRWALGPFADALKSQIEVAQVLGASWGQIWRDLVVPQIAPSLFKMGGLTAIWAAGDFALMGFISSHEVNLSLSAKLLLSSYRIHAAILLSLMALVIGVAFYFLISGVAIVGRKKSS